MSLLSQASLVVVPSGYKEDVVYSVKPTDGSGDLTFTRASDGTRVNSQGYVERVPWNLVQQSNTLNTTWSQINISVTSGQSGYDGSSDAWLLTTAASQGRVQQTLPTTSGVYTLSCYMKQGTNTRGVIRMNQGGSEFVAYFELDSGTAAAVSGNVIASAIESVGGGWYRCSAAFITATSSNSIGFGSAASGSNWTATTSGNIYIQDAQLVEGSTAKPYFPTTDRLNVPRLDYSGGCPSLLLEPQRTNYFEYSEDYSQIDWTKASLTVVSNAATSPDGYQNADKIYPSATGGFSYLYNISSTSSSVHTISAYVKADGKNIVWLYIQGGATYGTIYFDLSDQSIQVVGGSVSTPSGTITAVGSDWYRITFTTGSALAVTIGSGIGISDAKGNTYVTASGTNGVLVWGAQLEAGSYPTSYIPTTSASVTRVADAAYNLSASSLIGTTEGVMFIDIQTPSTIGANSTFSIGAGTSGEYAQIEIRTDLSINWRYRVGNTDYINANVGSFTAGSRLKIAFAYKNLDSILYLNGSSIATDTGTIATNAWDEVRFSNFAGTGNLEARVNETLLYKTRLTNAELAALTTL